MGSLLRTIRSKEQKNGNGVEVGRVQENAISGRIKQKIPRCIRKLENKLSKSYERISWYYQDDDRAARKFAEAFKSFEASPNFDLLYVPYRCLLANSINQNCDPVRFTNSFTNLSNETDLIAGEYNQENIVNFLGGLLRKEWNAADSIENLISTFDQNLDHFLLAEAARAANFFKGTSRDSVPFTEEFAYRTADAKEVRLCSAVLNHYVTQGWAEDNPFPKLSVLLETAKWLGATEEQLDAFSFVEERIFRLIAEGKKIDSALSFLIQQLEQEDGNENIYQVVQALVSETDPEIQREQIQRLESSLRGKVFPVFAASSAEETRIIEQQTGVFKDALAAFNNYIAVSRELNLLAKDLVPHDELIPNIYARFALAVSRSPQYIFTRQDPTSPVATDGSVRISEIEKSRIFDVDEDSVDSLAKYHDEWRWAKSELENLELSEFITSSHYMIITNRQQRFNLLLPRTELSEKPQIANYSIYYYADAENIRGKPLAFLVPTDVVDLIYQSSLYPIEDAASHNLKALDPSSITPDYLYSLAKEMDLPIINIGSGSNVTGFDGGLEANSSVLHEWERPFHDGFGVVWDNCRNFAGHVDKRFLRTRDNKILSQAEKQEIDSRLFCFHQQIKEVVEQFNIHKHLLLLRYAAYKQGTFITRQNDAERESFGDLAAGYDSLRMPVEALRIHHNLNVKGARQSEYPVIGFYPVGKVGSADLSPYHIDTYSLTVNYKDELAAVIPRPSGHSTEDFIKAVTNKNNFCLDWQAMIRPELGGLMPAIFSRDDFFRMTNNG